MKWLRWAFVYYNDIEQTAGNSLLRHLFKQVDCLKSITPGGDFLKESGPFRRWKLLKKVTIKSLTPSEVILIAYAWLYITRNNNLSDVFYDSVSLEVLPTSPIIRIHRFARKSIYLGGCSNKIQIATEASRIKKFIIDSSGNILVSKDV